MPPAFVMSGIVAVVVSLSDRQGKIDWSGLDAEIGNANNLQE
ncbi:MAG: hypothetical protein R3C56_28055 [Pirellulaceae bacterium]